MSRICGCRSSTSGRTPASPSSPASIRPVGPAPTMITSASITGHSPRSIPPRPRATRTSTTRLAFRDAPLRRLWPRRAILRHHPGLAASPPVGYTSKTERGNAPLPFHVVAAVDGSPAREPASAARTAAPLARLCKLLRGRTTRRERALMAAGRLACRREGPGLRGSESGAESSR
jgi:hypothetical protein